MSKLRVALFGSKSGSSIEYLLNTINTINVHNITITDLVLTSHIENLDTLTNLATKSDITLHIHDSEVFKSSGRKEFESQWREFHRQTNPHVIFLLGWNYILSKDVLNYFSDNNILVINLHPALPDTWIGENVIPSVYNEIKASNESKAVIGSQVHIVTPNIDLGYVIDQTAVEVNKNSLSAPQSLGRLLKAYEKPMILNVLFKLLNEMEDNQLSKLLMKQTPDKLVPFYRGKVRSVTNIGYNLLLMTASNRISAFNRHLTNVPDKGSLLNAMSAYWFQKTRHIINNHYLYSDQNYMIVHKCEPIMLEIVVRGYMTGSSETSIWTKYKAGDRTMYGLNFRDGYKKNELLDSIIITPTTKGEVDEPITKREIIQQNILEESEIDYVYEKARLLFEFGQAEAAKRGLLLVDTKYEFGFLNGEIILMDEIHTCDSSRYWKADSYAQLMEEGREPEKFDKDSIRDYVKKVYSDSDIKELDSFEIPDDVVNNVNSVYHQFYEMLTSSKLDTNNTNNNTNNNTKSKSSCVQLSPEEFVKTYFNNYHSELVVVLAGSLSDRAHVENIQRHLTKQNLYSIAYYKSAHKNTQEVIDILKKYDISDSNTYSRKIVFVTVAGRSNALSGVVASNVKYPVIACPPFKDKMDMFTNINSSLQCPSKVPVLTALEPENVALSIRYMFNM